MTGFNPSTYEDPRQAELLAWLRTNAPLPLIGADTCGIPRDLVQAWLTIQTSEFSKELARLRAHWVQTQVRIMLEPETSSNTAAKIKWLLSRVDPETFSDRPSSKPKDARHRPAPSPRQGKLDLSKLEEPERD